MALSTCGLCSWWLLNEISEWTFFLLMFKKFLSAFSFSFWQSGPSAAGLLQVHSRHCSPGDHPWGLKSSKGCHWFLPLLSMSQKSTHQMSAWTLLYEVSLWVYRDWGVAWEDSMSLIGAQVLCWELHSSMQTCWAGTFKSAAAELITTSFPRCSVLRKLALFISFCHAALFHRWPAPHRVV